MDSDMICNIPKKMTVEEARAVLMGLLFDSGEWSKTDIGKIFGKNKSTVSRIITSSKRKKHGKV